MDNWPIYFKDRLIISNLNSSIAIVTLWTPKDTVQKLVDPNSFLIMGQLYTKKGINYLLRNILANPVITDIFVAGNDLMESGETLLLFFKNGVDQNHKIIGDDSAELEKEIEFNSLEILRKNVKIHDLRGAENLKVLKEKVLEINQEANKEKVVPWAKPQTFPDPPKPQISSFPSEIDLFKIRRPTIAEGYLSVLKHIQKFGLESEPVINYVSDTSNKLKEILNLSVVITDEDISKPYIPEYLPFNQHDLENYYKGFFDYDKHTEDYTYGERLFNFASEEISELKKIYPWLAIDRFQEYLPYGGINQVAISIVRKLRNFKYDKGAIALLGNPFSDVFPRRPGKKIPCLFLIQCQIYQGKLTMTAYFRSNDMYNAWPLNAFALRKLQTEIAEQLEVENGALITISNMAHVYEHNFTDMEKILKENYKGYYCEWDPRGNFVIEVENKKIIVKQITPDGTKELNRWEVDGEKPHSARELSLMIENDLAISTLGNALDLGRQLSRAEIAIKLGLKFSQDNELDFSLIKTPR